VKCAQISRTPSHRVGLLPSRSLITDYFAAPCLAVERFSVEASEMVSHAKHGHHLVRLRHRWQDGRRLSGAEGLRSGDEHKAARGGETGGLQALERLDSCLGPMTVLQSWV
jgi:hypothetical protein